MARPIRPARMTFGPGGLSATGGSGIVLPGSGCLTYVGCYETTGSASASFELWDGSSQNGLVMAYYTLSSGQSTSEEWGLHWMPFEHGLYVATPSGSVAGTLTAWVDHRCQTWLLKKGALLEAELAEAAIELGVG